MKWTLKYVCKDVVVKKWNMVFWKSSVTKFCYPFLYFKVWKFKNVVYPALFLSTVVGQFLSFFHSFIESWWMTIAKLSQLAFIYLSYLFLCWRKCRLPTEQMNSHKYTLGNLILLVPLKRLFFFKDGFVCVRLKCVHRKELKDGGLKHAQCLPFILKYI